MKTHAITIKLSMGLSIGLLLCGCGNTVPPKPQENNIIETSISNLSDDSILKTPVNETKDKTTVSSIKPMKSIESTDAVQGGPYGRISLSIPDEWDYETYPIDNEQLITGMYGIHFYPKGVSDGYIELVYTNGFGVCGVGLKEEMTTIAGHPANIGTYDNNVYWDFISFREGYKGIVALTYDVDDWWGTYSEQVMNILDTLSFDSSAKEGGAYIYSDESELVKIGLSFSLKNISPTGATLILNQYDADAPTGEVEYGDDFILEIQKDGMWEEVPTVLKGNYGFNDIAHVIPSGSTTEQDLNWEWLYGALEPGHYRVIKSVMDFRGTRDYDKYTVYAQFVLT